MWAYYEIDKFRNGDFCYLLFIKYFFKIMHTEVYSIFKKLEFSS